MRPTRIFAASLAAAALSSGAALAASGSQAPTPSWGLDRIDQRTRPLDGNYSWASDGSGTSVYVFDTGVYSQHEDLSGRVVAGFDGIGDGRGTEDCNGHGTGSAGVIAGTRYGVAKAATIVPVRILDCKAGGNATAFYAGISWAIAHHQQGTPAVAHLALAGSRNEAMNEAMRLMIADGIVVVVSAGNAGRDACRYSPASEPSVITVGGSSRLVDARRKDSNYGPCVDIFAPGDDVVAAWWSGSKEYRMSSGTSRASAFVAGAVAMLLSANPSMTQDQVASSLVESSTKDALSGLDPTSANRLLFVGR